MQPRHALFATAFLALAACMLPAPEPVPTGAEDFATYCAVCHGPKGKGDGALAGSLDARPADLTRLARDNGGAFPATRAMAKIWGYTDAPEDGVMPDFGPLLQGELVPYDGGDGILTPTPIRLVQLAEYVKGLGG